MTAARTRATIAVCVATWSTTSTASAKTAGRARPVTHVSSALFHNIDCFLNIRNAFIYFATLICKNALYVRRS